MSYVSTTEQKNHGMSVDAQIKALEDFCTASGYMVYKIYNDAGISARKSYKGRPALLEMLSDCQQNKIDIVLFTRLDRFFRSVPDYYACIEQMNGVPWKAVLEDYETETPDGVFKVNIMLSVAQSEADKTSARLKDTFAYKRAKGDYIGKAPTGYKVRGGTLTKDKATEKAVSAMFKAYLMTFSPTRAMDAAADHGLMIERTSFLKMLSNPAYCGKASGGYMCEPYITEKEWEKIQSVKRSRTPKPIYGQRVYLFSGLVNCGYCGHRMAAKLVPRTRANGEKATYKKYVCEGYHSAPRKCPHLQITEAKLEEYLLTHLDALIKDCAVKAEVRLKGYNDGIKKKSRLQAKIERLKEVYIDGDISRDEYRERKKALETEIASITVPSVTIPTMPATWKEMYNELTEDRKQAFWKSIIKSITVTNETKDRPIIFFN